MFSNFSFSCTASSCACGFSDSGLIDDEKLLKHKSTAQTVNSLRSTADSMAMLNERKPPQTLRLKVPSDINAVNRAQSVLVNLTEKNIANDSFIKNAPAIKAIENKYNYKLMGKPPIGEKHLKGFHGLSLDEREMPITRERQSKLVPVKSIKRNGSEIHRKPAKMSGSPKLLRPMKCDAQFDRSGRTRYVL